MIAEISNTGFSVMVPRILSVGYGRFLRNKVDFLLDCIMSCPENDNLHLFVVSEVLTALVMKVFISLGYTEL
jgi:hypothetical protein